MNNKIVPAILLIAIISLAYALQFFYTETASAENQASSLEKQLEQYKNSAGSLQKNVDDLQSQLYSLQNPTYNVTIENVTQTGWMPLVSVFLEDSFYITIKNTGLRDVGGLTFQCNLLAENGSILDSEDYGVGFLSTYSGVLRVQESTILWASITCQIGAPFDGRSLQVIVLYDKTVLAETKYALGHGFGL